MKTDYRMHIESMEKILSSLVDDLGEEGLNYHEVSSAERYMANIQDGLTDLTEVLETIFRERGMV